MNKEIKRLFILFLVLTIVTTLLGCGKEKIELNSENCDTYLTIKGSHGFSGNKYNAGGRAVDAYDSYTFYAHCEGIDGYDFENVKITLQYELTYYPGSQPNGTRDIRYDLFVSGPYTTIDTLVVECNINGGVWWKSISG